MCLLRALLLCFEICGTVAHARASDEGLFLGDFLDILHAPANPSGLPEAESRARLELVVVHR